MKCVLLNVQEKATNNVSEDLLTQVKADRDRHAEDLAFVENSFTDLHKRYDNQRDVITELKKNEAALRQKLNDEKKAVAEAVGKFAVSTSCLPVSINVRMCK